MDHKSNRFLPAIGLALVLGMVALVLVSHMTMPPARAPYLELLGQGDAHALRAERTAAVAV